MRLATCFQHYTFQVDFATYTFLLDSWREKLFGVTGRLLRPTIASLTRFCFVVFRSMNESLHQTLWVRKRKHTLPRLHKGKYGLKRRPH